MKNYEEMSDFEINCRVHAEIMQISGLNSFKAKDYCSNPADAWPIIVENHIAVVPYQYTIPQAWPTAFGVASKFTTEDRNPLRAAMIVFLKMNEEGL
ncbi:hypothetical protein KGB37_gp23 [Escherichia phage vB_EcoS Sa179lw]|uniref:NinX n=1 Tax=Escherichia phage vB_EcoS Sa179lw TaxID=2126819 RepID=A0A2P1MXA7_9CAUD|nr:hypothetical protein KGB37_gp23 [Escherichia phage vB_EcoS Sa179lw]AVP40209.1 hypothetical protein vBEcoSSa179w3YLVW_00023 [Escherichia phage vB_EcoS Sa179lw]